MCAALLKGDATQYLAWGQEIRLKQTLWCKNSWGNHVIGGLGYSLHPFVPASNGRAISEIPVRREKREGHTHKENCN